MTGSAQVGKARKTRTTPRMTTASVISGAAAVSRPARQPAPALPNWLFIDQSAARSSLRCGPRRCACISLIRSLHRSPRRGAGDHPGRGRDDDMTGAG